MQNLAGGQGAGWHASGTPGKPSEGMLLKLAGKLPTGVLVELGCGAAVDSATALSTGGGREDSSPSSARS